MDSYTSALIQEPLPPEYADLSDEEIDRRIAQAKEKLGKSLVILGHHYQRDEVIKFADHRGDSLKLARWAAQQRDARYIVFCGVHFMAETADMLSRPDQAVILPDLSAGCSMADMAPAEEVERCWEALQETLGVSGSGVSGGSDADGGGPDSGATGGRETGSGATGTEETGSGRNGEKTGLLPICYINSSAELKAFVGRNDGAVCTSSNAHKVLEWALGRARTVLFFPDEHLGRNTAVRLGIPFEEIGVWRRGTEKLTRDPHTDKPLDPARLRLVLWNGYCSVHLRFTPEQIERVRAQFPETRVIVHPECRYEVVRLADASGSTEFIIKTVTESPPGTRWAVGTEINLVSRLAQENPDKIITTLDEIVCPCSTMYRISPQHLLWALENLVQGRVVNRITVPPDTKRWAMVALERMLAIV